MGTIYFLTQKEVTKSGKQSEMAAFFFFLQLFIVDDTRCK